MEFSSRSVHTLLVGTFVSLGMILSYPSTTSAVAITVDSVVGVWQNTIGGGGTVRKIDANNKVTNSNTNHIRWGGNTNAAVGSSLNTNDSGYKFIGIAPPSTAVVINTPFKLGTFTHFNEPINSGTSITGTDLFTTISLTIAGVSTGPLNFTYHFNHNETPNVASSCPGDAVPCNDIVTVSNIPQLLASFNIGGVDYTVGILGFGNAFSNFQTVENQTNTADLFAQITETINVQVPEPSTYLLLGSVLGVGLLVAKRRETALKAGMKR